ncbi:hypothetical protein G6F57_016910 [Rhizopus arrhizus]|nr:hypothetical protein G6F57_016910 [Rhizopus arrhizus]
MQHVQQGLLDQDEMDKVLVLSDADRAALNAQASRGLLLALAAQGAMGLAAAVIAGVVGGAAAGWSALAGAGAYFIPNALFALRLVVSVRAGRASPFTFLSGHPGVARCIARSDTHIEGLPPAFDVPQVVLAPSKRNCSVRHHQLRLVVLVRPDGSDRDFLPVARCSPRHQWRADPLPGFRGNDRRHGRRPGQGHRPQRQAPSFHRPAGAHRVPLDHPDERAGLAAG